MVELAVNGRKIYFSIVQPYGYPSQCVNKQFHMQNLRLQAPTILACILAGDRLFPVIPPNTEIGNAQPATQRNVSEMKCFRNGMCKQITTF